MSLIDRMLAPVRDANRIPVTEITKYLDSRRGKLRAPPSFYLDYMYGVWDALRDQGIYDALLAQRGPNDGILTRAELDQVEDYAERRVPAADFVNEVLRPMRGL